jgi:hypothetical protein
MPALPLGKNKLITSEYSFIHHACLSKDKSNNAQSISASIIVK